MTLERKNNNGPYSPKNVIWAPMIVQGSNTRRNVRVRYKGENLTVAQWARKRHIHVVTLWSRLFKAKWPIAQALGFEARR
jgi:hypothetical protein